MITAIEIGIAAVLFGVICGAMAGWCIGAWRNRITYPASEDDETYTTLERRYREAGE